MLKLTCPGIPDFYQGTELWDLTLVDPDNRRPVDYQYRMDLLQEIKAQGNLDFIKMALENKNDGKIKIFLISKILEVRQQYADLFLKGEYIPLEIEGDLNKYGIAFARKLGVSWAITIVPRFSRQFVEEQHHWKDAFLLLPKEAPQQWKNPLTGEKSKYFRKYFFGSDLFGHFPLACLLSLS